MARIVYSMMVSLRRIHRRAGRRHWLAARASRYPNFNRLLNLLESALQRFWHGPLGWVAK